MVRKLKHHERKLLKKVDFINWNQENNLKEISIMRRFHVDRLEYTKYNKLVREIKVLAEKIHGLPVNDPFKSRSSDELLSKLFDFGLISTKRLKKISKLSVKSFCRRRIAVFMLNSGMFNGPLSIAVKYIMDGHVRVGPKTIRDPAFIVSRGQEDFLSWSPEFKSSKIDSYHEGSDLRDDFRDD